MIVVLVAGVVGVVAGLFLGWVLIIRWSERRSIRLWDQQIAQDRAVISEYFRTRSEGGGIVVMEPLEASRDR